MELRRDGVPSDIVMVHAVKKLVPGRTGGSVGIPSKSSDG